MGEGVTGADILNQGSFNVTFVPHHTGINSLYFCELDT